MATLYYRHLHKIKSDSSKLYLGLGISSDLSEHFHGVGLGPLSKNLAIKVASGIKFLWSSESRPISMNIFLTFPSGF